VDEDDEDQQEKKARRRKLATYAFVGVTVAAWGIAFSSAFAPSEWVGFSASPSRTRGKDVSGAKKPIEQQNSEIDGALEGLKKDMLGRDGKTRGFDPKGPRANIPREMRRYTQRDACMQMKLEYPDRFGDVDCMADKFDDIDPWWQAPRKP
jgi:hypothetical protein